ncbi:IS1096 element passenger TnpR family protein [Psychromonas aquimarina]|uniref:IS1096 element passenger TnpR family protein n=1 Tax=Psychromonas aquimarina TaxID=444919 RepID=UPI0005618485|nr:hypothetical protein [Psychromonas aquimarina]
MIIVIKITLLSGFYASNEWSCEVEVDESIALEELHAEILNIIKFNNDHMYQFFISRREFGSERIHYDDREHSLSTKLLDLFPLPKNRKLFYNFDFGDDWIFQISKTRKKAKQPINGQIYPRVITESGKKPEQYPNSGWP